MTAQEVRALPIAEKIQIMEAIWDDLRERFDRMELPQAHKEILDRRRAHVEEGRAKLLDWDTVKSSIGRA
ncbi:MAG: addiction module protein [Verrucomicrobiae bacterium]|nr:addiction module protein [Verrucomicrobiae bacterium]